MMPDGRLGKFRCGSAMRKCHGPEGRIANRREICFEDGVVAGGVRVVKAERHYQVVWMLPILDGLAESSLARLEKKRILATADCRRLGAEHHIEKKAAPPNRVLSRAHENIR